MASSLLPSRASVAATEATRPLPLASVDGFYYVNRGNTTDTLKWAREQDQ